MNMTYKGQDSWDRAVYEDKEGNLWKDIIPIRGNVADLYSACNNEFDGEPDCPFHGEAEFKPGRVVWAKNGKVELE